jgi:hypothetical protein
MIAKTTFDCGRRSMRRPELVRDMRRWLPWVSGVVSIGSWRIVYLEIFRWQHVTRTLRFNPPPGSS